MQQLPNSPRRLTYSLTFPSVATRGQSSPTLGWCDKGGDACRGSLASCDQNANPQPPALQSTASCSIAALASKFRYR